jgi:hypothetical protein
LDTEWAEGLSASSSLSVKRASRSSSLVSSSSSGNKKPRVKEFFKPLVRLDSVKELVQELLELLFLEERSLLLVLSFKAVGRELACKGDGGAVAALGMDVERVYTTPSSGIGWKMLLSVKVTRSFRPIEESSMIAWVQLHAPEALQEL